MWAEDETTPAAPHPREPYRARGVSGRCPLCGQPTGGLLVCPACADAEWERLRAADPAWYERHKSYRLDHGTSDTHGPPRRPGGDHAARE